LSVSARFFMHSGNSCKLYRWTAGNIWSYLSSWLQNLFVFDMDMSYARRVPHPKVLHPRTASYSSHTSHSVSHVLHQRTASHSSYILHLTPYTLHLMSYTLHLTPYTLCLTPYILRLTSYTLHLTPYVLRLTSYILHLTPYVLHLTSYIWYHIVSYSVPCDMYTSCV
jgi:hypothetical protein